MYSPAFIEGYNSVVFSKANINLRKRQFAFVLQVYMSSANIFANENSKQKSTV